VWLRHVVSSWKNILHNRWLYFCRLPFLPELELMSGDLEVIDNRFSTQSGVTDLKHASLADKEAYKYSFSRTADWQGPVNYLRNLPLGDTSSLEIDKESRDRPIPVEALIIVGNREQDPGLELITRSTEYLERFAMQIVNGGGEAPHQEQPELVNRHISKFVRVPDVVRQEKGKRVEDEGMMGSEAVGGREGRDMSALPRARQQMLNNYTAPVTRVLDSSSSALSSLSSSASSLPLIGSYIPSLKNT